jgi:hypothetical protein
MLKIFWNQDIIGRFSMKSTSSKSSGFDQQLLTHI